MHRSLLSIVRDRRVWTGPLPWALLALLVANVAIRPWERSLDTMRRQNLLVSSSAATDHAGPPRYDESVGEDLATFWAHIPDARTTPLTIVAGMSQMYSVPDGRPSDGTVSELVDDALRPTGMRAFGLAAPNLDNEEALLYLVGSSASPETKPDVFVYGLCFDKMRNIDVRPRLAAWLRERPDVQASLRAACDNSGDRFPLACSKVRATLDGLTATEVAAKSDDRSERSLEARIRDAAAVLPMVEARKDLNFYVQVFAFETRNKVLGITSTTKRPIIRSRYVLNQELCALMIEVARRRGIDLVLYVVPLNANAETPYVPAEYEAFKRCIEITRDRGVPFANFEGLVPAEEWGVMNGEPDFKHFREGGHRRTAAAIVERFGPVFEAARRRRGRP